MNFPIITADERLAEKRGIKGCILGRSGIGKTSLLWTTDPKHTLFGTGQTALHFGTA